MTRNKLLIPVVLAVALLAALWFMVLAPKREQIAKLDRDIATQEASAIQSEELAAGYERAKANYRKNYTVLARLGKAVPADDDVRSLLVQISDAAARSKVNFRSLNVAGGGAAPAGTADAGTATGLAPAPGTVPVGSAGFSAMPFTFAFSGSFSRLSDFFQRLERFVTVENDRIGVTGRLLLLGNIAVTPDGGDLGKLQAQVGAATYLVPPNDGVPGAADPDVTEPGASAAPAATNPNIPTATNTGVR